MFARISYALAYATNKNYSTFVTWLAPTARFGCKLWDACDRPALEKFLAAANLHHLFCLLKITLDLH